MLEAELLPPARDDFDDSYAWYAKQSVRAADRFAESIDNALEKLCDDPTIGIRLDDDHWFYRLKKSFPFYLVYRIEPTKIVVVAVAHNRREPHYWQGR
jgi:plasmid stabilization system protein ParE